MHSKSSMPFYFRSLRTLLDKFIPAHWPEGHRRNQARNVTATSIAHVTMVIPFVPILIWQGNVVMSMFLLLGILVAMAVVLVLRYVGSLRISTAMSVTNNILLYLIGWYLGGRDDPAFPVIYALVPISTTFMLGAGAGFYATIYTIAAAMLMTIAPDYGWFPFEHAPMRDPQLMHSLYLIGTIGGAGVLSVLFQFSKTVSDLALQEARRNSEQLAAFRSQFLANMSHEIRTPMNAIIGLSGLALKNDMPAHVHDYLTKIQFSADHLLGIINDILDFSKIESGKQEIEALPFDLEAVINNVVNLVSDKADAKKLELLCRVDPGLPRSLIGDPLRVGQILINLVNNAVKFTHSGEIRISISAEFTTAQSVRVLFEVQDTGIGLSQVQMDRLFNSFEQADASTTRQYGGTGLGLAISKGLAQAMGGTIGVRSDAGVGSTFWFTAQMGVGTTERFMPTPPPDMRGRRILVVDDNETAGLILAETLGELGFAVDRVLGGHMALDRIRISEASKHPYSLVILDWLMPDMDGLQTIQAIRAQFPDTAPYVLMVTAHRRDEVVIQARALGVDNVLSKPVSGSVLFNTMMQLMGTHNHAARQMVLEREKSPLEVPLQRIRGARVLLVEDNDINQLVAREILEEAGFSVEVADNGEVAVRKALAQSDSGTPYALVLMDMQMPVMDGITATRLLRESFSATQLPIVAMTANAMKIDRDRCSQAGMNGFVVKPIDPNALWSAMLAVLPAPSQSELQPEGPTPMLQPKTDPGHTTVLAAPTTAQLLDALRRIPGLNVDRGVAHASHKPAFYLSLLQRVIASQSDAATRIADCLLRGDLSDAEREAHTLASVADNMGAAALHKCARALELSIQSGAPANEYTALLETTRRTLDSLVGACRAVPGFEPPAGVCDGVAPSRIPG